MVHTLMKFIALDDLIEDSKETFKDALNSLNEDAKLQLLKVEWNT
jgi:hypothetical protein